jgi:hypothetical protein
MGVERQVMQGYLEALAGRGDFPAYFTDDVIASFEGTDQAAVGRDRAGRLIRFVHESAFDARAELKNLLVDEGKAAIEADFVGTHTGEFAGSSLRAEPSVCRIRFLRPAWRQDQRAADLLPDEPPDRAAHGLSELASGHEHL